ncbi:50S ribosomal protein L29 [Patescibacteria group bacterium]|nr:50S ribosomal protein L29 [Patescibacteria group bacterium]
MKAKELRKKPKAKLQKILRDKREKLGDICFNLASGKIKNVREIKELKKDIARILTLLNKQRTKNDKQISS